MTEPSGRWRIDEEESTAASATVVSASTKTNTKEKKEEEFVINNRQLVLVGANLLNHVLVLLCVGWIAYTAIFAEEGGGLARPTNRHALLCTIGYVLLMAEAIVALADENTWTYRWTRSANVRLHWLVQLLGALLVYVGIADVYLARERTSAANGTSARHFFTTHGLCGIASALLIALVGSIGVLGLHAARLRHFLRPVLPKLAHNCLGALCFGLGLAAQFLALRRGWLRRLYGDAVAELLATATCLVGLLSLLAALRQLVGQWRAALSTT